MDNIYPDSPGYDNANIAGYWDDTFYVWAPASDTFSITNISEGSSSVNATFVSTSGFPLGTEIYFEMKDDGDFFSGEDWKIWACTVGVDQQF